MDGRGRVASGTKTESDSGDNAEEQLSRITSGTVVESTVLVVSMTLNCRVAYSTESMITCLA